jgi:hypothetical protein
MSFLPYKLKRWQWLLVGLALCCYFTFATFNVYGGFYLGFPPYTPLFMNDTRMVFERQINLTRKSRLHFYGELREGRTTVKLNGVEKAVLLGRIDRGIILEPGNWTLRLENNSSTGQLGFEIQ